MKKRPKMEITGVKLRGLNQNQIGSPKMTKMTGVIRKSQWVIWRMKHLRIWVPPTQNSSRNFEIGFPGFHENRSHKKSSLFLIPEFNLVII